MESCAERDDAEREQAEFERRDSRRPDPTEWVQQYGDAMFRFAIRKVHQRCIAEELVQESFLAALRSRKRYRGDANISTWLFSILRHKIADHFRRESCRPNCDRNENESIESHPNRNLKNRDWRADPAEVFEDGEFWQTFDQCIEKLPNKLAEVYILREVNEQSPKEISELLRISPTNLSMRLHRCRLALRKCLQQNWFQSES